jgi:hypothetical protein
MADTIVDASDRRIARVERILDLGGLLLGAAILLLAPGARVTLHVPSLVVAAGITLLGAGLLRDLAWLALQGRPNPAHRGGPPEVRLCLESTLGAAAVSGGLLWRLLAPGTPWSVPLGALVLALALVATLGQLTRNVILTARVEPGHRNMPFWS